MEFLDLINESFYQRALIGSLLVSVICAVLGVFVTLRKQAFLSDAIAHGSLSGVAFALLLGLSPIFFALVVASFMSVLIIYIKKKTDIASDSIIGIIFSLFFAIGIFLLHFDASYTPELDTYLFGNLLSVRVADIFFISFILLLLIIFIGFKYKELLFSVFDPDMARVKRIKVDLYEYLLAILMACVIVVSIKVVGVLLVGAFIVIPASSAKLLAKKFDDMIPLSLIHNVTVTLLGLIFLTAYPPGPSIVIISALLFFVILIYKQVRYK